MCGVPATYMAHKDAFRVPLKEQLSCNVAFLLNLENCLSFEFVLDL